MTEAKQAFWGLIELMGHAKIAGLVSEVEMGGAKLLRVDVPDMPEQQQRWRDAQPAIPAYTRFVGGAAIYAITPMSEEACRSLIDSLRIDPVYVVGMHHIERVVAVESPKQLPTGECNQDISDLATAKMRDYLRDIGDAPTLGLVPPHAGLRKAQYESDEAPF